MKNFFSLTFALFLTIQFFGQTIEYLEVESGITISNSIAIPPVEGTIRYNSTSKDFEGWNGTDWLSLSCCSSSPELYYCVDGACVSGEQGIYGSLEECLGEVSVDTAFISTGIINGNMEPSVQLVYSNGNSAEIFVQDSITGNFIQGCPNNQTTMGILIGQSTQFNPLCSDYGSGIYKFIFKMQNPVCNPSIKLVDLDDGGNNESVINISPFATSLGLLNQSDNPTLPLSNFTLLPSANNITQVSPSGQNNFGWLNFTGTNISCIEITMSKGYGAGIGFSDMVFPNCCE